MSRHLLLVLLASLAVSEGAEAQPAVPKPPIGPTKEGAPKTELPKGDSSKGAPAKPKPDAGRGDPKEGPTKSDGKGADAAKPIASKPIDDRRVQRSVTAVVDLAAALDAALPPLEGRVLVGVAPLATDVPAPRGKALSVTIAQVFAGRRKLEPPTETETLEALRGRAHEVRALVYLTPRIVNGEVTVSADVFPVPRTVWARIRNPVPGPFAHAFAKAFIDAEVRSHLEPIPMTGFDTSRGKNFESGVVALACDDLDRDGAPEIVSLSRKSVSISRLRAGRVEPFASHPWSDLSSMAPSPLREAIGFATTARAGAEALAPRVVVASITDRQKAVELDDAFELIGAFPAMAVPDGDAFACARLPALTVTGPFVPCDADSASPSRASVGGRYDAVASAKLVTPDGKPFVVTAGREDGTLEIFDDQNHHVTIPHVGAQLAIGDLDQDGTPEILTSLDVVNGSPDALVIYSWSRADGRTREMVRMPVAAGVHAIAVCPPESTKRAAFVMATVDELVVLR